MASVSGFKTRIKPLFDSSSSSSSSAISDDGFVTLIEYLGKGGGIGVNDELVVLIDHIQYACKRIAALVASPFNYSIGKQTDVPTSGSDRDAPKPLDILTVCFSSHLLNFMTLGFVFSF
jgi:fructose-1,6-bisphosphatase I